MDFFGKFLESLSNLARAGELYIAGIQSESVAQPRLWVIPFVLLNFFLVFGPCPRLVDSKIPGGWITYAFTIFVLVLFASTAQSYVQGDLEFSIAGYLPVSIPKLLVLQLGCVLSQFLVFLFFVWNGHLDLGNPRHIEAEKQWIYYPHVGTCLALLIYFVTILGWIAATWWLRDTHKEYMDQGIKFGALLRDLNLENQPKLNPGLAWATSTPIQYLFEVLTVSSLILILAVGPLLHLIPFTAIESISGSEILSKLSDGFENRLFVRAAAFLAIVGIVWFIVAGGQRFDGLASLIQSVRRTFSYGGMGVVSLSAIVIAVCWVAGVSYVRTVMIGDRTLVFWYLLAFYSLFWCHEYWLHQAVNTATMSVFTDAGPQNPKPEPSGKGENVSGLAESGLEVGNKNAEVPELLPLSDQRKAIRKVEKYQRANTARIDFSPESMSASGFGAASDIGSEKEPVESTVIAREDSFLEVRIYGAAQLAIYKGSKSGEAPEFKRAFEPVALFETLIERISDKQLDKSGKVPLRTVATELKNRYAGRRLWHFTSMKALAIVLVFGFFAIIFRGYRVPNLESKRTGASNGFSLTLLDQNQGKERKSGQRERLIFVAASGGGTRAALFTQSGLAGLQRLGELENVRLVSGVSGGGVALGYFASHRSKLLAVKKTSGGTVAESENSSEGDPWGDFANAMSHDYIIDVLRGASEFRISKQSFVNTLLAESLGREFSNCEQEKELPIGVIFNSTLVGSAESNRETLKEDKKVERIRVSQPSAASTANGGSRVIYTNLADAEGMFRMPSDSFGPGDYLHYEVVPIDSALLTKALALNANFPPVFPNAPVDLEIEEEDTTSMKRLWVTDGGAQENKGVLALLYALLGTVERDQSELKNRMHNGQSQQPEPLNHARDMSLLPDVTIVVFDASGGSLHYQHDQGVSAALAAPTRLANQLAIELHHRLVTAYQAMNQKLPPEFQGQEPPNIELVEIPMPSCMRIDGGIGTHWMLPRTVTFSNFQAKPGQSKTILLNRDVVRRVIEDLHREKSARHTDPASVGFKSDEYSKVGSALVTLWDWIDNDPVFASRGHQNRWNELKKLFESAN